MRKIRVHLANGLRAVSQAQPNPEYTRPKPQFTGRCSTLTRRLIRPKVFGDLARAVGVLSSTINTFDR